MTSQTRVLLGQANQLREQGKFLESLQLCDQVILLALQDNDLLTAAEAQSARFIAFKLLYRDSPGSSYLILAKHAAMVGVDLAKASNQPQALPIPLFNLGKCEVEMEDYSSAIEHYQEAINAFQENAPTSHNRPGVLADMKTHLSVAEIKNGDQSAIERLKLAVEELEHSGEDQVSQYNFDVWRSGGYMHLADILREQSPEKAREYLEKAREIIESNPELTLRQEQLAKLATKFS